MLQRADDSPCLHMIAGGAGSARPPLTVPGWPTLGGDMVSPSERFFFSMLTGSFWHVPSLFQEGNQTGKCPVSLILELGSKSRSLGSPLCRDPTHDPTICQVCCGHLAHPAEGQTFFTSGIAFSAPPLSGERGELALARPGAWRDRPPSSPRSCQPSVSVLLTCHQQGEMLPPPPSSAGLICTPRALKSIQKSRIVSHLP